MANNRGLSAGVSGPGYAFAEAFFAGEVTGESGVGHDQGEATVTFSEKDACSVPANRAIVGVERGELDRRVT